MCISIEGWIRIRGYEKLGLSHVRVFFSFHLNFKLHKFIFRVGTGSTGYWIIHGFQKLDPEPLENLPSPQPCLPVLASSFNQIRPGVLQGSFLAPRQYASEYVPAHGVSS